MSTGSTAKPVTHRRVLREEPACFVQEEVLDRIEVAERLSTTARERGACSKAGAPTALGKRFLGGC